MTFRPISQAWCGFLDIGNILAEDCRKPDMGSPNVVGDPEKYHLFLHVLTHTHTHELSHVYTQDTSKHGEPSISVVPPLRVRTCGSADEL